ESYNKHVFDRCNFFCQFKKLDPADYAKVLSVSAEIEIADDLIQHLYGETGGNLRKLGKALERLEGYARVRKLTRVTIDDLKKKAEAV
ncbi:MAG TPA: hypothetical protein PKI15_11070, partial [Candidatus Cloacimonadota bacterium]|nr:hypothetical protein [Candidatus Cloacimonadota bacterium]